MWRDALSPASPGALNGLEARVGCQNMRTALVRRGLLPSWDEPHVCRFWLRPRARFCQSLSGYTRRPQLQGCSLNATAQRGAKSTTTVDLINLAPEGTPREVLPDLDYSDALQYPVVVQGAKNNMLKFKNCVLLTRVGNFYEVCSGAMLLSLFLTSSSYTLSMRKTTPPRSI